MTTKDVVIGAGEVGSVLAKMLETVIPVEIRDIDPLKELRPFEGKTDTDFLHICIPYSNEFIYQVKKYCSQYYPLKVIIIHSTVPPGTGEKLQQQIHIPIISSPVRGVHRNFEEDMKKYVKWFGFNDKYDSNIEDQFEKRMNSIGIKTGYMKNGRTCELAKILVDTTHYGWKIIYRYITDWIAEEHGIDSDEMWKMNDDSYQPVTYSDPNGIGGHCVMPNLDLMSSSQFQAYIGLFIKFMNEKQKERYQSR